MRKRTHPMTIMREIWHADKDFMREIGDRVTPENVDKIAAKFGTSKELWINLQNAFDNSN